MAGPQILVSFLADFSKLKAGINDVGTAAKGSGKGLSDAFGPALSALNRTGVLGPFQDALGGISDSIKTVKEHINDLPIAMAAVGGGVAAIGVGLSVLGSKDQAAHQQLQAAVQATGKDYDDYAGQVDKAVKSQEKYGHTATDTQDALAKLTEATNDPAKALQLLSTASDLAAAKHESLTGAAGQLGKAYNGNTRILKEFGVQVTKTASSTNLMTKANTEVNKSNTEMQKAQQKLADTQAELAGKSKLTVAEQIRLRDAHAAVTKAAQDQDKAHKDLMAAQAAAAGATNNNGKALDLLSAKLKGQASAASDTFAGKLRGIKAAVEDSVASLGQKYGPALQAAGGAMAGLGAAMKAGQVAMDAAKAAALGTRVELLIMSGAQKIAAAAQWALNAAMDANPIVLIVIAIAALIAIIVLVLVKTGLLKDAWNDIKKVADIVWHGILDAIKAVWNWIQSNWPLLLGILLGPFGLAAALIYKYWAQIQAGLLAVWHWIQSVWAQVYGFLVTPIAAAINWITKAWGAVTNTIAGVVNWIRAVWSSVYGFLTSTIAAAVGWIAGAWGGVTGAVSRTIGYIEGAWSGLLSFFSGIAGRISSVASGMWSGISSGLSSAMGLVKSIWNSVASHSALHINWSGPFGLGINVSTPQLIPSLAQGGLMTNDGLVYAHAGEVITPAPVAARGPAVVIENANFSSEIDIDLFMKRAAWATQRAAI